MKPYSRPTLRVLSAERGKLALMGQLTTWAEDYKAGDLTFDELADKVKGFDFKTPERYVDRPSDPEGAYAHTEDKGFGDADTPDELVRIWAKNLLTDDEYVALIRQMSRG